jgi:hypothetical protein
LDNSSKRILKTATNKDLGLFKNIWVPKFAAKIRRRGLKTENDQKKTGLIFSRQPHRLSCVIKGNYNRNV